MTVVAIIAIVYMAVVAGIAASSDRLDVPFQRWHGIRPFWFVWLGLSWQLSVLAVSIRLLS